MSISCFAQVSNFEVFLSSCRTIFQWHSVTPLFFTNMSMSPEPSRKQLSSPAAGSGISAVRCMHADVAGNSTTGAESTAEIQLKLRVQNALEAVLLSEEKETPCAQISPNLSATRKMSALAPRQGKPICTEDRYTLDMQLRARAQSALERALLLEEPETPPAQATPISASTAKRPASAMGQMKPVRVEDHESTSDGQLRLRAQSALEAALLPEEKETPHSQVSPNISATSKRLLSTAEQEERHRMECNVCGYKSVPQWLNDEAHCLKCQAVLKRRPNIHQKSDATSRARSNSRPATAPGNSGKNMCAATLVRTHDVRRNTTRNPTLLSSLSSSQPMTKAADRVRVECNVCGYKCVPQWLNDEAHCLKCQAVLKRRPSVHQKSNVSLARSGQRRVTTPARLCDKVSSRQLVGPERFFYDKSTYTGAHAVAGPH